MENHDVSRRCYDEFSDRQEKTWHLLAMQPQYEHAQTANFCQDKYGRDRTCQEKSAQGKMTPLLPPLLFTLPRSLFLSLVLCS